MRDYPRSAPYLFIGVVAALCGCGGNGSQADATDASSADEGTVGGSVNGAGPDRGAPADDGAVGNANDAGPGDGGTTGTADASDGGAASDGSGDDARADAAAAADAACTPPAAGTFSCGGQSCDGVTSYCLAGSTHDTCVPLPSQCQCAETLDCACMLAHVANPCGFGTLKCSPMYDGGLYWLLNVACP